MSDPPPTSPQPWPTSGQPQYGPPPPVSGPPGYPPVGVPYPPQPPPKKSKTNLVLSIIGGVVAVCCGVPTVLAAIGHSTRPANSSQGTAAPAAVATTGSAQPLPSSVPTAPPPAPKAAGLNQPVRDGKFEFVVTAVKCGVSKVGDSYLNKKAQGQFCEVFVTVKNIGNEPRTFDGGNQRAFGVGGVKYEHDGVAELYANNNDETFLNDINPGNSVKGLLVFDIARDAKLVSLELHDSFFSGGAKVTLG